VFDNFPKVLPTTIPITEPMMTPAAKSENQWMLTETETFYACAD
jgi:hypothetical protein